MRPSRRWIDPGSATLHRRPCWSAFPFVALLAACASGSGAGVPALAPSHTAHAQFAGLSPREIGYTITDNRQPIPPTSAATVAQIDTALASVFRSAHIPVRLDAANRLAIVIFYPDSAIGSFQPVDCLMMSGTLKLADGARIFAGGFGCMSAKNVFGMRLYDDPTTVYQQAFNDVITGLDKALPAGPSS